MANKKVKTKKDDFNIVQEIQELPINKLLKKGFLNYIETNEIDIKNKDELIKELKIYENMDMEVK